MPEDRQKRKEAGQDRHGGGPRPLAASVGTVSKRALGKRGFAEAGLITGWEAIVGPELAVSCRPERLSFPPGKREGGTLRVVVAGGIATELQHMEPVVLDRINGHFGYRAVARLTLVHGVVEAPRRKSSSRMETVHDDGPQRDDRGRLGEELSRVDDPEIRDALARLGRAILGERKRNSES